MRQESLVKLSSGRRPPMGSDVSGGAPLNADVCPGCGAGAASVDIALDDQVVTMRSCNRCDQRWWTCGGEPVDPVKLFAGR